MFWRREGRVRVPVAVLALFGWGPCHLWAAPDVDHEKSASEWRARARDWREDAARHDKDALENARKAEKALAERDYRAQDRYNREARMHSHLARSARNRASACELWARKHEANQAGNWREAGRLAVQIRRLDYEFERQNSEYFMSIGQQDLARRARDRATEHLREFHRVAHAARSLGVDVEMDIDARHAGKTRSKAVKKGGAARRKPSPDEPGKLRHKVRELKDKAKDAGTAKKAQVEMMSEIRAAMPRATEMRAALMRAYISLGDATVGPALERLEQELAAIRAESREPSKKPTSKSPAR